jgi:hypothetical protein
MILVAGAVFLAACNSATKPSDSNFRKAIDEYLVKHGDTCTVIDRQFPIDLPKLEQNEQYGIGPKLAALTQAGLMHATDTTAVVHGLLDLLQGSGPAQPVRRYELTEFGKKYFQQIAGGVFGRTTQFCYGHKTVDAIVKWTQPATMGGSTQTEVTYTYKIADLAAWAERPEVLRAFSDIQVEIAGQSKVAQIAGLQLTNKGWEVPAQ